MIIRRFIFQQKGQKSVFFCIFEAVFLKFRPFL